VFSSGECERGSLSALEALAGARSPLMIAGSLLYAYLLAGNAGSLLGCLKWTAPTLTMTIPLAKWPL
jgi:hypothetical protein